VGQSGDASSSTSARACAEAVARGCLASRVRMLGRVVSALYQEELEPHGLTVGQYNILTALCLAGRMSPVALSARLRLEKSTVSRNLGLMIASGWVHAEGKGRGQQLSPTARGQRLFQAAFPAWQKAQRRTKDLLGAAGVEALSRVADGIAPG
jgi:DNA-binding MarR family transcriptional regulator